MLYNLLQYGDQWLGQWAGYSLLRVLYQIEFRAFAAAITAFFFVLIFGKPSIHWLIRKKIGDSPEFEHADLNQLMRSKKHTPTMGGILIVGGILVATLLLADLQNKYVHISMLVMIWLAGVGIADDWLKLTVSSRNSGGRDGLKKWEKLLFQFGIGLVAAYYIWVLAGTNDAAHALVLPLQRTYEPHTETLVLENGVIILGFWTFLVMVAVMIAGTSNAVNITDGMDGLAPGTVAIASLGILALAYIAGSAERSQTMLFPWIDGSSELTVVAAAMAGACLGFLWFNCAPASVFMGDTGSLALGGLLATIACCIRQEFLLLLIGGVFYLEMGSVILQTRWFKLTRRFGRDKEGKRLFLCAPIHHHFHLLGWQEAQVVVRFWVVAVVFVLMALVMIKIR
ncbi:MAG: phospho-N-acetylmuramoyl-pentapeptide-transferase [Phycisphaerae bacterium]|nr:phospho-N-acetylmuramoyl-pentapeptide-transferase [Phycisphaerae bacterium]MBT5656996.1 phospho-N-acetylmuramoyl-pentapeptide-transferase [Phycisphaerae bacterium]